VNEVREEVGLLPRELLAPELAIQRRRVLRLAYTALRTPGLRLTGLVLLVFSSVFARWFLAGIAAERERTEVLPFVYTMR
jgi:hypothetical protein